MPKLNKKYLTSSFLTGVTLLSALVTSETTFATARSTVSDGNITDGKNFAPIGFDDGDSLTMGNVVAAFGSGHRITISDITDPMPSSVDFVTTDGEIQFTGGDNYISNIAYTSTGGAFDSSMVNIRIADPGTSVTFNGSFELSPSTDLLGTIEVGAGTTATFNVDVDGGFISNNNLVNLTGGISVHNILNSDGSVVNVNGDVSAAEFYNSTTSKAAAPISININNGTLSINKIAINAAGNNRALSDVYLTNNNSKLRLTGDSLLYTFNVRNETGTSGNGEIIIAGTGATISSGFNGLATFGSPGQKLKNLSFETDVTCEFLLDDTVGGTNRDIRIYTANPISPLNSLGSGNGTFKINETDASAAVNSMNIDFDIGTSSLKLKAIELTGSLSKSDRNITLKNNRKLYTTEGVSFTYPDNWQLTIEDNAFIDGAITTLNNSENGDITFEGNSIINSNIGQPEAGRVQSVTFIGGADKNIDISSNIYANSISQGDHSLTLQNDVIFQGSYNIDNSTHNAGLNRLSVQQRISSANLDIGVMAGSEKFNFTANDNNAGSFFASGGQFDASLATINLNLTDISTTVAVANSDPLDENGNPYREIVIFGADSGGLMTIPNLADINYQILSSTNNLVQWELIRTDNEIKIRKTTTPDILAATVQQAVAQVTDQPETNTPVAITNITNIATASQQITNDLATNINQSTAAEFIARLQTDLTEITEIAHAHQQHSQNTIKTYLNSTSLQGALSGLYNTADSGDMPIYMAEASNDYTTGISAGDGIRDHGAWSNYSYSHVTQKKIGRSPGYKSIAHNISIGADTMIQDNTTLGAALGIVRNNVKHKNTNTGDRSSSNSYIASIYGMYEFGSSMFVQGLASIGHSNFKNSELRNGAGIKEVAQAKFNVNSYGLELISGYDYITQSRILLTPIIGASYSMVGKSKYQETGTTNQNLKVSKKPDHKLALMAGGRIAQNYRSNDYDITPEIHFTISHDILDRNLKINASLDQAPDPLVVKSSEHSQTFYNLGTKITTAMEPYDATFSYDVYLAKKHVAHQGSVKLRVNF